MMLSIARKSRRMNGRMNLPVLAPARDVPAGVAPHVSLIQTVWEDLFPPAAQQLHIQCQRACRSIQVWSSFGIFHHHWLCVYMWSHQESLLPCNTRTGRTLSWHFQGVRERQGLWFDQQKEYRFWPSCRSLYRQQGRERSHLSFLQHATWYTSPLMDFPSPIDVSRVWSVLGPVVELVCPLRWSHETSPELVNPQRWSSKEHILGMAHSRFTKLTSSMATRPSKPERITSKISWK